MLWTRTTPTTFVPVYLDGDPERPNPRARILDCEARPKAKFEDECRGLFGVCMLPKSERGLPVPDGVGPEDPEYYTGDRMQPFNYTGCMVVGGAAWGAACKAKFLHITETATFGQPGSVWKNGGDTTWENNPFLNRYGDTWEAELRKTMRSAKKIWVNDLIAHTVSEGNRLYKGTPWENSWVMYHDALSAWWDPGAQALVKKLGMEKRQILARGPTVIPLSPALSSVLTIFTPSLLPTPISYSPLLHCRLTKRTRVAMW